MPKKKSSRVRSKNAMWRFEATRVGGPAGSSAYLAAYHPKNLNGFCRKDPDNTVIQVVHLPSGLSAILSFEDFKLLVDSVINKVGLRRDT